MVQTLAADHGVCGDVFINGGIMGGDGYADKIMGEDFAKQQ